MVRSQISLRLDKIKRERLIGIAKIRHTTYADLIREKVDEILMNGNTEDLKEKVKRIIKEINTPFFFFKTQRGKQYAKAERQRREVIAQKMERLFNIN